MRAGMRWTAIVLVLTLIGGGGYYYWQQRTQATRAAARPRFITADVRRGNVESVVTGTGPVASLNGVTVRANVQGTVSNLLARDGDTIKAGFTVVELTNESTVASYSQALIDYDKARADLDNLLRPEATAVRAQELKLESARLSLQQREADVASLRVASPCTCVVVDVKVSAGDAVKADALLLTLYDDARPAVVAHVSQAFATYIRPGQAAKVTITGMGTREGEVSLVGTSATAGAKDATVPVTIALPAWFGLRPGMLAQVGLIPDLDPNLGYLQVSGTVPTADIQEVRAKVAADAVASLAAQPGDRVDRGALLAELQNDLLQVQVQQAANDVATQELNLRSLVNPLGDANGTARQLQSRVASTENTVKARKNDVDDLTVAAPVNGTVSSLNLRIGDRITPNTALFRVADYTGMQVDINVDELDIAKVKPGLPATITLDALPGKTYPGKVLKVNPEGQFRNDIANFIVTVQFDETQGLMAGMNATVNVQVERKQNVLRVPAQAVTVRQGRASVRLFKGDTETPEVRPVEVGLRTAEWAEVLSGLKEGDKVVLAEVRQNSAQPAGFLPFGGGGQRPPGLTGVPGGGGGIPGGGGGGGGTPGGTGGAPGGGQVRTPEGGRR